VKMHTAGQTNRRSCERVEGLIRACLKVLKRNIPVAVVWYQRGQVRKIGSQNLAKWMETLDETLLERAMVCDEESLINGDEPLVCGKIEVEVLATNLLQDIQKSQKIELKPLPFPLSLMSKKEKAKYLSDPIQEENREKRFQMVYGHPACRPSFWPQEVWAWENVKKCLAKTNEENYTGPGTYTDFLSICVRRLLEKDGRDPETFVCQEQNEAKIKKKLSMRGLTGSNVDAKMLTAVDPSQDIKSELGDSKDHLLETKHEGIAEIRGDKVLMNQDFVTKSSSFEGDITNENQVIVTTGRKEVFKVNIEDPLACDDETEMAAEDDSPVSITINSKGHEPVQITLNRLKRKRTQDS